ncbi:MAG TPA: hypothetical protein VNJ08_12110 [Bacteriovoracaceae bacterium]|nr:hypothetical protein [Bacteriovoracaceae bacterium]
MKKLLVLLMCFQLILAPVAHAAGSESPQIPTDTQKATDYDKSSQSGDGGYDFYMKQIMMIAMNIIGSNIIVACPAGLKQPSIVMFEAASIIYIASEIAAGKAISDKYKKSMDKLEMDQAKMAKEGTDLQKQALIQARTSEEDMLDYLENKRNWQVALTVAYSAAAATAVGEQIYGLITGYAAGAAACGGVCGTTGPGVFACMGVCASGGTSVGIWIPQLSMGMPDPVSAVASACAPTGILFPACDAAGMAYTGMVVPYCTALGLAGSYTLNVVINAAIVGAWGLAGIGANLKSGGGDIATWGIVLTMLAGMIPPLNAFIIMAYQYPIPRFATFTSAAILSGIITDGLQERINIAEENIRKLNAVINDFKDTTAKNDVKPIAEGAKTTATSGGGGGGGDSGGYVVPGGPPTKASSGNCLSKGGGKPSFGPQACAKPVRVSAPNMRIGPGMEGLQNVADLTAEMANQAAAGNTQGANATAVKIGALAGRVKDINDGLKKKLNDMLHTKGQKPVDFDGEVKKQLAHFQGIANEAAAAKGISPSSGGSAKLDPLASVKPSGPTMVDKAPTGLPATPVLGMGAFPEDAGLGVKAETGLSESLSGFESSVNDINKDNGVSLFLIISNRYAHSYSKIMKRKEVPAAEPKKEVQAPK